MALTSYRWKGAELNDGISFLVPYSNFDDRNPVDTAYAYRNELVPVQTGVTVKEATFALNITIVATSKQDFDAKLDSLIALFNPQSNPTAQRFERKRDWEQFYRYVEARPTSFSVNMLERKVTIIMTAADMNWKEDVQQTQTASNIFNSATSASMSINYTGNIPVEPIIEIKALSASSESPNPIYYQEVQVFIDDFDKQPYVKIAHNWNVSALVSAGKMQSNYSDINVWWSPKVRETYLRRRCIGANTALNIWVELTRNRPATVLPVCKVITTLGVGMTVGATTFDFTDPYQQLPTDSTELSTLLVGRYIAVRDEVMLITAVSDLRTTSGIVRVTVTRGQLGTTAVAHPDTIMFTNVKWGYSMYINYGYGAGYSKDHNTSWFGFPNINFQTSDNKYWRQTEMMPQRGVSNNPAERNLKDLGWFAANGPYRVKTGEFLYARPTASTVGGPKDGQFFGAYGIKPAPNQTAGTVQRFVLDRMGYPRNIDSIQVKATCSAGSNTVEGGYTLYVSKVLRDFGLATREINEEVWSTVVAAGTVNALRDSGEIVLHKYWYELDDITHLTIEMYPTPPQSTQQVFVTITEVILGMDTDTTNYPVAVFKGGERGPATGEFSAYIQIKNQSDAVNPNWLIFNTRMSANEVNIIDAGEMTVSGAPIESITNWHMPTWLRLMPGNNIISLNTLVGSGTFEVKIKWKNRF